MASKSSRWANQKMDCSQRVSLWQSQNCIFGNSIAKRFKEVIDMGKPTKVKKPKKKVKKTVKKE